MKRTLFHIAIILSGIAIGMLVQEWITIQTERARQTVSFQFMADQLHDYKPRGWTPEGPPPRKKL